MSTHLPGHVSAFFTLFCINQICNQQLKVCHGNGLAPDSHIGKTCILPELQSTCFGGSEYSNPMTFCHRPLVDDLSNM